MIYPDVQLPPLDFNTRIKACPMPGCGAAWDLRVDESAERVECSCGAVFNVRRYRVAVPEREIKYARFPALDPGKAYVFTAIRFRLESR